MKKFTVKTLKVTAALAVAMALAGCAAAPMTSTDEYGNKCVLGQTCGAFTSKSYDKVMTEMTVVEINRPGSTGWKEAVRTTAPCGVSEPEVMAYVADKDFVRTRRMGFLFAVNHFAAAFGNGHRVGEVVTIKIGIPGTGDMESCVSHIIAVEKSADN